MFDLQGQMVVIRVRKNKDLMWKLAQACEAYEVRKRIIILCNAI